MIPDRRFDELRRARRAELELFARKAAIVFGFALFLVFLWFARRVLILLFIAGILAAGIAPAVRRVRTLIRHYTRRKIRRGAAVLIVYLPFVIAAVLFLTIGVPRLVSESQDLAVELPRLIDQRLLTPFADVLPIQQIRIILYGDWRSEIPLFGYLRSAVTLVASVVVVLFLIAYMLIDAERLRNIFLLLFPPEERARKRAMVLRVSRRMSHWLAGQLILAGIIGVATFVGLVALGIPYAFPLAVVAALGELIPVIGPIAGAIPAVIVALFQSNWQFWAVLGMAFLIQQVENYVLVPRILGKKVSVSPLAIFVAFLIGGSLLGIVGAIMAIPAVAIMQVAFEEAFVTRRERRLDSTRPGTLKRTDRLA